MSPNSMTKACGLFIACALLFVPPLAPRARQAAASHAPGGPATSARPSAQDAAELVGRIKTVESPAFRAYLYARVVSWLRPHAGSDPAVGQAVLDAAAAGVADISAHEGEIPAAPAAGFYRELLAAVRARSPEEAERLGKTHPLRRESETSEETKAGASFNASVARLANAQTAQQGARELAALLHSGKVAPAALHGELLGLDQINSPALPQVLDLALAAEERRPGTIPPMTLHFIARLYLKDSTPAALRARFLAAADRATRIDLTASGLAPEVRSNVILLLRTLLPHLRQHAPELYAGAAARLAALAPGAQQEDAVWERIRNSSDPLAQTLAEAGAARTPARKKELTESAARLALRQGKLRRAVELMASVKEDAPPDRYSSRDEFFDDVAQDALKAKDVETARYAAAQVTRAINRAETLRRIARHFAAAADDQARAETLDEAARALADAPDVKEKAAAYFGLASDFAPLDRERALELARAGVKATNNITRPALDDEGRFTHSLFPLADITIRLFRLLARDGRDDALGLAAVFRPKEFALAAALGAHSPDEK